MKKKIVRNLSLSKRTISTISDAQNLIGGTDGGMSFGAERCMEEFTQGCSPTFLTQCPPPPTTLLTDGDTCSQAPNCY